MNRITDYQLKPLEKAKLSTVLEWRNGEHVKPYMYTDHAIMWEEHLQWYEKLKENPTEKVLLLYWQGQPIGLVSFKQIDLTHSRCYWGFYIGNSSAPKGSGTVLGILALDYIFEEVGIRKLCAEVIETNVRSYHYHQKLGFEEEGRLKEHICKDNRYIDVFTMGIFADKWKEVREKLVNQWEGTK